MRKGNSLRPMFPYYGSKWSKILKYYPEPKYDTIIEPFAGSASYALHYYERNVVLYEKYDKVAAVWDYLINASSREIRELPYEFGLVSDLVNIPQEARWLIGFWINAATVSPCNKPSAWVRAYPGKANWFNPRFRERVATQVELIKHWKVIHGSYDGALNREATWFVDPPYQDAGGHYVESEVDYAQLASWCKERKGQVIVCENAGADWLPFEELCSFRGAHKRRQTIEAIWTKG